MASKRGLEVRRGRPPSTYKKSLRKAKKADYEALARACVETIITGQTSLLVRLSYLTKLPDDFPFGNVVEKTERENVHQIKANKLLTWLHEKGYTDISCESLAVQQRRMTMFIDSLGIDNFEEEGE